MFILLNIFEMSMNFIDTIMVRNNTKRGTSSEEKPILPADFKGHYITTGKRTSRIKL
jgi:hypothetical protein